MLKNLSIYFACPEGTHQFHGDYWHGNPKIYKSDSINPQNKKTYGELYANTQRIDLTIKNLGYNLVVMWEIDYRRYL